MLGTRSICLSCQISEKLTSRKSLIFSEGARVVSVNFLDLGQMVKKMDRVGVDLGYVGPNLSICEVKI